MDGNLKMRNEKEIGAAIRDLTGDVAKFMGQAAGYRVAGDGVVVEKSVFADVVHVRRVVDGAEDFACYVQFEGKENPRTLAWSCDADADVRGVHTLDGQPTQPEQLDALRSALGLAPFQACRTTVSKGARPAAHV